MSTDPTLLAIANALTAHVKPLHDALVHAAPVIADAYLSEIARQVRGMASAGETKTSNEEDHRA